jgi:hypothetical protein
MEEIIRDLTSIISLLRKSRLYNQADWLEQRLEQITSNSRPISALRDIKKIIAGIGSLSDVYLSVKDKSFNEVEQNLLYQKILVKLDEEIIKVLRKN